MFVANDQMALGVLQALQQNGLRIPEDVSVVGFDDIPESAYFLPSLTTIRLDFTALGRRCAEHLLAKIRGLPFPSSFPLEPQLLVRASTAAPA